MDEIIADKLERIEGKIDRVCRAVYGDDVDENKPGIKTRLDRVEQFMAYLKRLLAWFGALLAALIGETAYRFLGGHKP